MNSLSSNSNDGQPCAQGIVLPRSSSSLACTRWPTSTVLYLLCKSIGPLPKPSIMSRRSAPRSLPEQVAHHQRHILRQPKTHGFWYTRPRLICCLLTWARLCCLVSFSLSPFFSLSICSKFGTKNTTFCRFRISRVVACMPELQAILVGP